MGKFQGKSKSNAIIKQIIISALAIILTIIVATFIESYVDKRPSVSEAKRIAMEYVKTHIDNAQDMNFEFVYTYRQYPNSNASDCEVWLITIGAKSESDVGEGVENESTYRVVVDVKNGDVLLSEKS